MTGTVADRNQMVALATAKTDDDVAIWEFAADNGTTCYYPVLAANKQTPAPNLTLEAVTSWPLAGERALKGDDDNHKDYTINADGNTYTIYTATGLAWVANQVNRGNAFEGKTITLGNAIKLDDDTVDGYTNGGTVNWVPIGTSPYQFKGTFDGKGHTISGVYINDNDNNTVHLGLFGRVMGNIQKLGVIDSSIESTRGVTFVGGVAAYLYRQDSTNTTSQIANCYYSGTIRGTGNNTGGIVGANEQNTNIVNCYNTGDITFTARGRVGGISGFNEGKIEHCYNTGIITITASGSMSGGGIVGRTTASGSIKNCYNTGDITCAGSSDAYYVGGLVGNLKGTCQYSYNIGEMTATVDQNVGSVVGAFINVDSTASIEHCFYNNELSGTTNGIGYTEKSLSTDHITGYTTAQMTGMPYDEEFPDTKTNQMNFGHNVMYWTYHENAFTDTKHTYYYPTLNNNVQTPAPSTVKTVPTITVSLADWVYGATASTPVPTTNSTSTAITYQYCETIDGTYTPALSSTNASTYYVKAQIAGNDAFTPAESAPVAFHITPATITDTTQTVQNAVYNGSAFTIAAANGTTVKSQTLTVNYGTGDAANSTIPSFTEAGDYTVSYTLSAPNHNDLNGSIAFTIAKAASSVTSGDADQTVTYGDTLTLTAAAAIAHTPTVPDDGTAVAATNATAIENSTDNMTPVPSTANGTDDTTNTTDATNGTDDGVSTPTVSAAANKFVFTATPAAGGAEVTLGEVAETAGANNIATASFNYNTTDKAIAPGDYTIRVYYGGGDNLAAATAETVTVTLKPKEITATTTNLVTKAYDGTNTLADVALEVKSSQLANPSDTVTVTATATYPDAAVGSRKAISFINLVQGGADSAYYTAIPSTMVLGEITAKALSDEMIAEIANQVYTGSDISPDVTVTNGTLTLTLGTDYTVAYTNDCKNVAPQNAAADVTPTVTVTAVVDSNYTGTASKTFAITPAPLTIKANNLLVYNGGAEPTYTYTVTGAKDDLGIALTAVPTLTCDVVPDANGNLTTNGSYTITVAGAVASSNYTLAMEHGTLTVASRPVVTVTPPAPVVTPAPEATPTPTPTKKPTAAKPSVSDKPEASPTPVATAKPNATPAPQASGSDTAENDLTAATPTPQVENTVAEPTTTGNAPAMMIGLAAALVALGTGIFFIMKKRSQNTGD